MVAIIVRCCYNKYRINTKGAMICEEVNVEDAIFVSCCLFAGGVFDDSHRSEGGQCVL